MPVLEAPPALSFLQGIAHAHGHIRLGQQFGPFGSLHLFHDVLGKVQIALVSRLVVHEGDRLQYAQWGHSPVHPASVDVTAGAGTDLCDGVVEQPLGCLERLLVSHQPVAFYQAKQRVFASPHIPSFQLVLGVVVADVAVGQLGGYQFLFGVLNLGQQFRTFVVAVG